MVACAFFVGAANAAPATLVESAATASSVIDTWVPLWGATAPELLGEIDTTAPGLMIIIR